MTDLIGKQLGQYQILEEIGRGGMAVVYKGYQPSLQRYVAVKVLLPHLSRDPELLQRFSREARSAAMLRHPNIVRVYDVDEQGGVYYLVMDYIPGPSLATRLRREGALDPRAALAILRDVGAALDHAHAHNVIHRDVKPSNILLAANGQAILSDFGIAKPLADSRLTQTGTAIGTPAYMSPEQVVGQAVDARSDLYSLGIVLYEMLTGRVPFHADTPMAVLYKQVHESPPAPSQVNPAISGRLEHVILHAMQKDPGKRYGSAAEMVQDCAAAVGAGPGPFAPVRPAPVSRPASPGQRSATSGSTPLIAAIAGLLIIALVWLLSSARGGWNRTPELVLPVSQATNRPAASLVPASAASRTPTPVRGRTASPVPTQPRPTRSPSPRPAGPAGAVATPYVRVASSPDRLNVRSGPGEAYDVLAKAYDGEILPLLGRDSAGNWLKVRASDGTEGWVSAQWVRPSVNVSGLPVLPIPPRPAQTRVDPIFRADQMTIARGNCTTLRWDVDDVQALYLDSRGVGGHGSQRVCPTSTQTYTLVVVQRDGQHISWLLTITVS